MSQPRPPFIVSTEDVEAEQHSYPGSDEKLGHSRSIGRKAGLQKIGLHVQRLEPGQRTSYPHAEEKEEEFVYVLEGEVDVWVDGHLHPARAGDLIAFPAGTGICHSIINNSAADARVLVGGEATRRDNRIYYPRNPERRDQLSWIMWWDDIPLREQGPHDGKPNPR